MRGGFGFGGPIHASVFLALYVAIRFVWPQLLDEIHPFASYAFEVLFSASVLLFFIRQEKTRPKFSPLLPLHTISAGVVGFLCFRFAGWRGIEVPFDLAGRATLVLLLAVGPALEELLFRGALWRLVQNIRNDQFTPWLGTSAAFAFSHFAAWWTVPPAWRGFILFQTLYTLGLGLYCGHFRRITGGMGVPVLVHALFNLGFYLGSL